MEWNIVVGNEKISQHREQPRFGPDPMTKLFATAESFFDRVYGQSLCAYRMSRKRKGHGVEHCNVRLYPTFEILQSHLAARPCYWFGIANNNQRKSGPRTRGRLHFRDST